jgi:hypothetical protein
VGGVTDQIVPVLAALLAAAALGPVLFVPFVAGSYRRHGELSAGRLLLGPAALVYAAALIAFVVLPLPATDEMACVAAAQLRPLQFVADIRTDGLRAVAQVVANVALFVPFGVLGRLRTGRPVAVLALAGFGLSLFVELTQLTGNWFLHPCPYRLFDVDDLLANTAGALLGAAAAALLWRPGPVVPAGLPRPVLAGRRLLGALCDLVGAGLIGVGTVAVLRVAGATDTAATAGGVGLPWLVLFVLVPMVGRGGTPGQRAVLLRPVLPGGGRPSPIRRLVRSLAGTGGFVLLLGLLLLGLSPTGAALFGLLGLVGLLATEHHRGFGGLITDTVLADRRPASVAAPPRQQSHFHVVG